jgi:hypothetical protein
MLGGYGRGGFGARSRKRVDESLLQTRDKDDTLPRSEGKSSLYERRESNSTAKTRRGKSRSSNTGLSKTFHTPHVGNVSQARL